MESESEQDHPRKAGVKPENRLLRFGLAGITAFVLSEIIFRVTHLAHLFPSGPYGTDWAEFISRQLIVPFALFLGLAAAAYPRRWLSSRYNALIVAAVGAAMGCLFFYLSLEWVLLRSHVRYGYWRALLGAPVPLGVGVQITMWLIAAGVSAMLITFLHRGPALFVTVAVLCLLAVVLPSPTVNLLTNNQELTVAFVVPVDLGPSAAKPPRALGYNSNGIDQAGANAVAAHVLQALRAAGLMGQYRVDQIWVCGSGKKSLQIIVLNPPVPAQAQLPEPNGTELVYVSKPDGWQKIPAPAPTLIRSVKVKTPTPGRPWLATACIDVAGGGGPCPAIWPN